MHRILALIFALGLTLSLSAQDQPSPQVWLSLRGNFTQSTPQSDALTAASDWAVSYGADVMFELNATGRLRPAVGLGLEVTNVNTLVEHEFIVNESSVNEMIVPVDINVRTRLTNLSVPVQLNWFPGAPGPTSNFFVFLRSDLLVGLGAGSGEAEDTDGGRLSDRRLQRGLPVEQADVAHLLGFGAGWQGEVGPRGKLLRIQPMVRFSTLDLLDDPGTSTGSDRVNYLRATDILDLGLNISVGF